MSLFRCTSEARLSNRSLLFLNWVTEDCVPRIIQTSAAWLVSWIDLNILVQLRRIVWYLDFIAMFRTVIIIYVMWLRELLD